MIIAEETDSIERLLGLMGEGDIERSVVIPLLKIHEAVPRIRDLSSVDHTVRETISALRDYTLTVEDQYCPVKIGSPAAPHF